MHADIVAAWRSDIFHHTIIGTDNRDEPAAATRRHRLRKRAADDTTASSLSSESPKRRRHGVLCPIHPNMSARQLRTRSPTKDSDPAVPTASAYDYQRGATLSRSKSSMRTPSPTKQRSGTTDHGRTAQVTALAGESPLSRVIQEQTDADAALSYRGGSSYIGVDDSSDWGGGALEAVNDEIERTPRAGGRGQRPPRPQHASMSAFAQAVALHPRPAEVRSHPAPSISGSSMSSQSLSTASKRSRSPVKSLQDLESLDIPVYWDTVSTAKACSKKMMSLCPESIGLVNALRDIVNGNTPYIPAALQKELEDDDDFECPENAFSPPGASEASATLFELHYQLKELRRLVHNTTQCQKLVRSEPAWNEEIHKPVLSLAVENTPDVQAENVTRAGIAKVFLPPGAGLPTTDSSNNNDTAGGVVVSTSGKMVDYALVLQLPQDHALRRRIATFLRSRTIAGVSDSINQTTYRPLKYAPAGVFVETKADRGSADEGRTQLGLWVAAWFRRIEALMTDSSAPLPMLPLLLALSDAWDCYFACRVGGQIRIVGPLRAGSTANLASAFKLHAVLQEISRYVDEDFRHWVEQLVGFDE